MRIIFLFAILYAGLISQAFANSTVSCHCFQERQYQPQKSHAADPYFLATTQNSLMSVAYAVDKKSLVRSKMSGAAGDELWVVHELARQSGLPRSAIAGVYREIGSWQLTVDELQIPGKLAPNILKKLGQPERLVAEIVDALLIEKVTIADTQLQMLRGRELRNKEVILVVFLSRVSGLDPQKILDRHKSGESWGKLLYDLGLFDGKSIERTWRELLSG